MIATDNHHTESFWRAAGERWFNGERLDTIAADLGVKTAQLDRQIGKLGYTADAKRVRNGLPTRPQTVRKPRPVVAPSAPEGGESIVASYQEQVRILGQELADSRHDTNLAQQKIDNLRAEVNRLERELRLVSHAPATDRQVAIRLVKQTFGEMSRRYHPDLHPNDPRAGERQMIVNACIQDLLSRFKSL